MSDTTLKPLTVQVELPKEALSVAWMDGARSGLILGLIVGLLAGYLLWRTRES